MKFFDPQHQDSELTCSDFLTYLFLPILSDEFVLLVWFILEYFVPYYLFPIRLICTDKSYTIYTSRLSHYIIFCQQSPDEGVETIEYYDAELSFESTTDTEDDTLDTKVLPQIEKCCHRDVKTSGGITSKLTRKIPERPNERRFDCFYCIL